MARDTCQNYCTCTRAKSTILTGDNTRLRISPLHYSCMYMPPHIKLYSRYCHAKIGPGEKSGPLLVTKNGPTPDHFWLPKLVRVAKSGPGNRVPQLPSDVCVGPISISSRAVIAEMYKRTFSYMHIFSYMHGKYARTCTADNTCRFQ